MIDKCVQARRPRRTSLRQMDHISGGSASGLRSDRPSPPGLSLRPSPPGLSLRPLRGDAGDIHLRGHEVSTPVVQLQTKDLHHSLIQDVRGDDEREQADSPSTRDSNSPKQIFHISREEEKHTLLVPPLIGLPHHQQAATHIQIVPRSYANIPPFSTIIEQRQMEEEEEEEEESPHHTDDDNVSEVREEEVDSSKEGDFDEQPMEEGDLVENEGLSDSDSRSLSRREGSGEDNHQQPLIIQVPRGGGRDLDSVRPVRQREIDRTMVGRIPDNTDRDISTSLAMTGSHSLLMNWARPVQQQAGTHSTQILLLDECEKEEEENSSI